MAQHPSDFPIAPELRFMSEALVSLIEQPAAIVANGELVVARNPPWEQATRCAVASAKHSTLAESLQKFTSSEPLFEALRRGSPAAGEIRACRPTQSPPTDGQAYDEYLVQWRQIDLAGGGRTFAFVVLRYAAEIEYLSSVVSSQRARINQLLIRQALIEEAERRRIGRALHDVVAQNLAHLRMDLARAPATGGNLTAMMATLDRVIEDVRTLAFELSPPVLEDLGLLPALHWLAEHKGRRHDVQISVSDDGCEPPLSPKDRIIVYRAVRELVINATKHAVGAEIVVSSVTNHASTRIVVRDTGAGFDVNLAQGSADGVHHFGLLSVEQQLRGIGGRLDLASQPGEGTRATILLPIRPQKDAAHG